MSDGTDPQSVYMTLLRAQEEVEALQRWDEYLHVEQRELKTVHATIAERAADAPAALAKGLRHTEPPLTEAIRTRLRVIDDELSRLESRVEAAQEHLRTCEEALRAVGGPKVVSGGTHVPR